MLTVSDLAGPECRIVLIGASRYAPDSRLPDLETVATNVDDLSRVLVRRCGVPDEQITVVKDPANPAELAAVIAREAERAGDLFLLYYAGHGVLDSDAALHLATGATVDESQVLLGHQALAFADISALLRDSCPARRIVAVVDACYAGRASAPSTGMYSGFDRVGQGSCLLAAVSRDERALAPIGERHTVFSGLLIDLLEHGDPTVGPQLTLAEVIQVLVRQLPARGLPAPHTIAVDRIDDLVLAGNPAYRPPALAVPTPPDGAELFEDGETVCPYPGLRAFTRTEARFFNGRENLIATLLERVHSRAEAGGGPLFVVGCSGSGKSSLIHAGLLPELARGGAAEGTSAYWPVLTLTPGDDPIGALADVLAGPALTDVAQLRDRLTTAPEELAPLLREILPQQHKKHNATRLVLVVDQFEELFAAEQDPVAQHAFITALTTAAGGAAPTAVVIAVMRADFVSRATAFPALAEALGRDQMVVGAMKRSQIRAAIEKPARLAGLALGDGLTDVIRADLGADRNGGYDPGALPLLGHALYETWRRRSNRVLTVADYRAAGSIRGALADTADAVYVTLSTDEKVICRSVFVRLINPADRTRRTLARTSLPSSEQTQSVLDRLAAHRLLTLDHSGHGSRDTVTITHEALIDGWPRLARWVEQDEQFEQVVQETEPDALRWDDSARTERPHRRPLRWFANPPGAHLLYSDRRLAGIDDRLAGRRPDDPTVVAFLSASRRAVSRRRRVRSAFIAGLIVVSVGAIVAAGVAFVQYNSANDQKRRAIARELVAQAESMRNSDPYTALQLGVVADRLHHSVDSTSGIISTITSGYSGAPLTFPGHNGVNSLVSSRDGRTVAIGLGDGTIQLWDMSDVTEPRPLADPLAGERSNIFSMALSPDDNTLAASSFDGTVWLWDITDRENPRQLGQPLTLLGNGRDDSGRQVQFSPTGRVLATSGRGAVELWDITDLRAPRRFGHPLTVVGKDASTAAFSPDGNTLATDTGNTVVLWDVTDPAAPHHLGTPLSVAGKGEIAALTISDHGILAVSTYDSIVQLWDLADPSAPRRLGNPATLSECGQIGALTFSPDEALLAIGCEDGSTQLWDTSDPAAPLPLGGPSYRSDVSAVEFTGAGKYVVAGYSDGTVRLWDIADQITPAPLGSLTTGTDRWQAAAAPNAAIVGVLDRNGARLWDIEDPEAPRPIGAAIQVSDSGTASSLSFFPSDEPILALGSTTGNVFLWDIADPATPHPLGHPLRAPTPEVGAGKETFDMTPDGRLIFPPFNGAGSVTLNTVAADQAGAVVRSISVSQDGNTLVAGLANGTVRIWDITDRAAPHLASVPTVHVDIPADDEPPFMEFTPVTSSALSPSGHILAAATSIGVSGEAGDSVVRLWDVRDPSSPRPLHKLPADAAIDVTSLSFAPDGFTLAAAFGDGTIRLWDTSDELAPLLLPKSIIATSSAHVGVSALSFMEGQVLIAGIADGTIQFWDTADSQKPRKLIEMRTSKAANSAPSKEEEDAAPSVLVLDGNKLLTARSDDDTIRLWDTAKIKDLQQHGLERACRLLDEGLSREQWDIYIPDLPYETTCSPS
ncbi:caspase, EACC1-associated type [Nocardia carnea]|uniref:caspase, EACC1-associated type n=1 Tax=Nocardia carnea TaxID=37328 RepID=UPI002454E29C|nr:AAA family ATPase [Nocardia carnea]